MSLVRFTNFVSKPAAVSAVTPSPLDHVHDADSLIISESDDLARLSPDPQFLSSSSTILVRQEPPSAVIQFGRNGDSPDYSDMDTGAYRHIPEESFRQHFEFSEFIEECSFNSLCHANGFIGTYDKQADLNRKINFFGALNYLTLLEPDELLDELRGHIRWTQEHAVQARLQAYTFSENLTSAHSWLNRYNELYDKDRRHGYRLDHLEPYQHLRAEILSQFRDIDLEALEGSNYKDLVEYAFQGETRITVPILLDAFIRARLKNSWINWVVNTYARIVKKGRLKIAYLDELLINSKLPLYNEHFVPFRDVFRYIDPVNPELSFHWANPWDFISMEVSVKGEADADRLIQALQDKGWLVSHTTIEEGNELRLCFPAAPLLVGDPDGDNLEITLRIVRRAAKRAIRPESSSQVA